MVPKHDIYTANSTIIQQIRGHECVGLRWGLLSVPPYFQPEMEGIDTGSSPEPGGDPLADFTAYILSEGQGNPRHYPRPKTGPQRQGGPSLRMMQ